MRRSRVSGPYANSMTNFLRHRRHIVIQSSCLWYVPPAGCEGSDSFTSSPALVCVPRLHDSCPDGCSHTSWGLICIFPVTGDIEHLFTGLWTICVPSLEKYLFKFVCPFLNWVAFLWSSCKRSLYFLDVSPLSDRWLVNILSHSVFFFSLAWWHPLKHTSLKFT